MDTFIAIGGRWVSVDSVESFDMKRHDVEDKYRVFMKSGDWFYVSLHEQQLLRTRIHLT